MSNGFIKKSKIKQINRKLSVTERAKIKFNEQEKSPAASQTATGLSQAEMDEMLDNPLTQLYNMKHPEVIEEAHERSYTD